MKDLYLKLSLPRNASTAQIERALRQLPPGARDEAGYVLLHEGRRRLYDKTFDHLQRISELRRDMELDLAPYGARPEYLGFQNRERHSPVDAAREAMRASTGCNVPPPSKNRHRLTVFNIITFTLLWMMTATMCSTGRKLAAPRQAPPPAATPEVPTDAP